jgi:hypothetical protein
MEVRDELRSTVRGADHDDPLNANALPCLSTASQAFVLAQEMPDGVFAASTPADHDQDVPL